MFEASDEVIRKALVALAIERTLLEMGDPVLEEVSRRLVKEYKCYIPDCHEHPEYLKKVLKDLYGASYTTILESIRGKLDEFIHKKSIAEFLRVMEC